MSDSFNAFAYSQWVRKQQKAQEFGEDIHNQMYNRITHNIFIPDFINTVKLRSLETYKKIIVYRFIYELNKCYYE